VDYATASPIRADRAARELEERVRDDHLRRRLRHALQDRLAADQRGGHHRDGHEDGETGGTIGNTLPEEGNDTTQVRCIERDFPGAYMGVSRLLKRQTVYGPISWMGSLVQDAQDASGLMYRRNRYYDPQTGKFTQEDPAGLAGGINAYGFANGDPVGYSDPYGLKADECDPPRTDCSVAQQVNDATEQTVVTVLNKTGEVGSSIYDFLDRSGHWLLREGAIQLGIGIATEGGSIAAEALVSATRGTRYIYSARVLMRAAEEAGPYHNFPMSVDEAVVNEGARTVRQGFWRTARANLSNNSVSYELRGALNGRQGTYEIFTRPSASGRTEVIVHRFFHPD
jgi:RHS repeat-associated protein